MQQTVANKCETNNTNNIPWCPYQPQEKTGFSCSLLRADLYQPQWPTHIPIFNDGGWGLIVKPDN